MILVRADAYRPHLGEAFAACTEAGLRADLTLESVQAFETPATEGFSLLFTGPRSVLLPQGSHTLEHPALGRLELFLVPVMDPRAEVYTYEAIFNHLRPAAQVPLSGGA